MSPEVLALISDGIKIIGPALVTGIATYLIARVQIQSKIKEIVAGGELKARESLFTYYRERGEHLRTSSKDFGNELGKTYSRLGTVGNDDEPFGENFIQLSAKIFGIASRMVPVEFNIAQAELRSSGLQESVEFASLKEVVSKHSWSAPITNRGELRVRLEALIELYLHLERCNQRVLEAQIKDLFRPYLNRPKTA
jgi:hypothetical protein